MTESRLRATMKSRAPSVVRGVLRAGLHYVQRLFRWTVILNQIQGKTLGDEWILIRSAFYAPIVSARQILSWQDPVLIAPCHVMVRGIGEFRLRPFCDDLWHVLPWREQAIANMLRSILRPGDVFIDAGANIGIYTVMASALVGPEGQVIAVEMMPDTAERLSEHVQINGLANVRVVRNALSDTTGEEVGAIIPEGRYGQASISRSAADGFTGRSFTVSTTTLDKVASECGLIRLIKIDVEGAELKALSGARAVLEKTANVVYENWGHASIAEDPVDSLLVRAGFRLEQLDGNNKYATKPDFLV